MKSLFVVLCILIFSRAQAETSDLKSCLKVLKKSCAGQSYTSAVVRCSWGLTGAESIKCRPMFNLLFQHSLSKMEQFKAEECLGIPGCNEYSDKTWQNQYNQNRKRILDAFRKKLIEPENLEKLYEAL